jgi:hypothetical protein
MIVAVQGTKSFNDYSVFLRAMGTALSEMSKDDKELIMYAAGPYGVNAMGLEFMNVSEAGFRARGIKTRFMKVNEKFLKDNIHTIGYLAFFSKPKEPLSTLVNFADKRDVEVGVYRY